MADNFPAGTEGLPEHLRRELTFWRNHTSIIGKLTRYAAYCEFFGDYAGRQYGVVGDIGCGPIPFMNWMYAETMVAIDPLVEFYHEIPHWARFWRMNDIRSCKDIGELPALYLDCALLLNFLDHIEPDTRGEYFETLYTRLSPGCIVIIFTHIRVKPDQFHFVTGIDESEALASKRLHKIRSGVTDQKFKHWPQESWWGVYQKSE